MDLDMQKNLPIQCATGGLIHMGPDLMRLSNGLDVHWPDSSTITCSKFTWYWIREATDGIIYQHVEKSGSELFVYFSPKQDGFYAAQIIIDENVSKYKVRINKLGGNPCPQ